MGERKAGREEGWGRQKIGEKTESVQESIEPGIRGEEQKETEDKASRCKCVEQRSVKFNMFWKYAQQVVSLNTLEANEIPCLFVSMTTEALFGEMIFIAISKV